MSQKIEAKTEIRDMKILKDTLTKMGYSVNEHGNIVQARKNHMSYTFSEGMVACEDVHQYGIEPVYAQYQKNVQTNKLEQQGRLFNVTETEDEILIGVKASM